MGGFVHFGTNGTKIAKKMVTPFESFSPCTQSNCPVWSDCQSTL